MRFSIVILSALSLAGCSEEVSCGNKNLQEQVIDHIKNESITLTTGAVAESDVFVQSVNATPEAVRLKEAFRDYSELMGKQFSGQSPSEVPGRILPGSIWGGRDAYEKIAMNENVMSTLIAEVAMNKGDGLMSFIAYCFGMPSRCASGTPSINTILENKDKWNRKIIERFNALRRDYVISSVLTAASDPSRKLIQCNAVVTHTVEGKYHATDQQITFAAQLDESNVWHFELQ